MAEMTGEGAVPARATRREWIGLGVLTLAALVYAMDLTVLNLAIPRISAELQPTSAQLLWIFDIYGFLVAGLLVTMGTLGDRIGRRKLLLGGAAGFALASLLAAFSTSSEMLIASRAVMGIAGATIAPSTLSLIFTMFLDPKQRTTAIGVWIAAYSAGGAIGPVLGGVLLEFFWWGSVFLIGVPVMGLLLILGPRTLPEYRDPNARPIDLGSVAMSLFAILAVVFGLKEIAQGGLAPLPVLSIVAGIGLGVWFVRRQLHLESPIIDVRLFRIRAFSRFARDLPAQHLRRRRLLPLHRAVPAARPRAVAHRGCGLVASVSGRLHRRFHGRAEDHSSLPPVGDHGRGHGHRRGRDGGAARPRARQRSGIAVITFASIVISLGLAPVITLATELIVGSAPPEQAGAATGMSETSGELGGALGIALLGSLGTAVYRSEIADSLPSGIPAEVVGAAQDTLGGALAVAEELPEALGGALVAVSQTAFMDALHFVAGVATVLAILTAAVAAIALRSVPARDESPAEGATPEPAGITD